MLINGVPIGARPMIGKKNGENRIFKIPFPEKYDLYLEITWNGVSLMPIPNKSELSSVGFYKSPGSRSILMGLPPNKDESLVANLGLNEVRKLRYY
jgi:hypothetical protein